MQMIGRYVLNNSANFNSTIISDFTQTW
jgi:hypothetical protein